MGNHYQTFSLSSKVFNDLLVMTHPTTESDDKDKLWYLSEPQDKLNDQ